MADAQSGPSCLTFLNEGLLLPALNRSVFLPILALTVAYSAFVNHATTLALTGALRPNDMAAAYLLAAFAGPTIRAITAAAAVATYTERPAVSSFHALISAALRGGLKASPAATAADANVVWLASWVGGGAALGFLRTLMVRYFLTPPLIDLLVALHLAHRLLQSYLGAVSSLAVVVALSEPACHGTAAIRRAWRLVTRENVAWSALLVAAEAALAGVVPLWYEDAASEHILWTGYVLLRGGAAVLGVCAATAYYHCCTQRVAASGVATPGSGKEWLKRFNSLGEMLQGRSSMRRILMTTLEQARCLSLQMFVCVAGAPLVFFLLAATCAWIATQGTPSVFLQNDLVLLRSHLRATYEGGLNRREHGVCPKPTQAFYSVIHKA